MKTNNACRYDMECTPGLPQFQYKAFFYTECPQKLIVEKSQNRRFKIVKECYFATGPQGHRV